MAVWYSDDALGGITDPDHDIMVSRSTDNGATWTAPAALDTNAATNSWWDEFPQVTTDCSGHWVAVWSSYDTLDGTIGTDYDILFARSDNIMATDGDVPADTSETDTGTQDGGDTGSNPVSNSLCGAPGTSAYAIVGLVLVASGWRRRRR